MSTDDAVIVVLGVLVPEPIEGFATLQECYLEQDFYDMCPVRVAVQGGALIGRIVVGSKAGGVSWCDRIRVSQDNRRRVQEEVKPYSNNTPRLWLVHVTDWF